jgi:hypothetical protein
MKPDARLSAVRSMIGGSWKLVGPLQVVKTMTQTTKTYSDMTRSKQDFRLPAQTRESGGWITGNQHDLISNLHRRP